MFDNFLGQVSAAEVWRQKAALQPPQTKHPLRLRTYSGHLYDMKYDFNSTSIQSRIYCLTSVIEALESFKDFDPNIRAAAIALRAKELGINSLHFYAIALHAGLEVAQ